MDSNLNIEKSEGNKIKSEDEKKYGESIYNEAAALLREFLPQALPEEPTVILTKNLFDPAYLGKVRGKHYIVFPSGTQLMAENLLNNADPEKKEGQTIHWFSIFGMAHELIHQKHAEMVKEFGEVARPDLNLDPNESDPQSFTELLIKARNEKDKEVKNYAGSNNLFYTVVEGVANLGELYVMNRVLERVEKSGDTDTIERLHGLKKDRLKLLEKNKTDADSYDGIFIMRKLYRQFGLERVPDLIKSVDLAACSKIARNSPEFTEIVKDPSKL